MSFVHVPVLRDEVLSVLAPRAGELFVDCTLGGGGHSEAILAAADCRIIGLDRDPLAIEAARARLAPYGERFVAIHARFSEIERILGERNETGANGILADLGVSSPQLDEPGRGFSFREAGPIDMRMDPSAPFSAADIVNGWSELEITRILHEYAEEPRARAIARCIVAGRPWSETRSLASAIAGVVGRWEKKIHPATRVFQALRIAVNDELGELSRLLESVPCVLIPEGRLAIISFHSLEDRIVKQFLAKGVGRGVERDPYGHPLMPPLFFPLPPSLRPSPDDPNPRARSARLRAAVRLPWNLP